MKHILSGISISSRAPVWSCALLALILLFLPTGFEENLVFQESDIRPALVLSTDESTVDVLVIPTDEEAEIARDTALIASGVDISDPWSN